MSAMIATDREVTLGSDAYRRAEERLEEWAAERARITGALRVPVLSSMSVMIAYLRLEEEPQRIVRSDAPTRKEREQRRRRRAKQYRTRVCTNTLCRRIYAAACCPNCGQEPLEVTARGTATRSVTDQRPVGFSNTVAQIDGIIERMQNGYRSAIFRAYMYRQPDRIAARELQMPRERFTLLRERAVIAIAEKLAERRGSAV